MRHWRFMLHTDALVRLPLLMGNQGVGVTAPCYALLARVAYGEGPGRSRSGPISIRS